MRSSIKEDVQSQSRNRTYVPKDFRGLAVVTMGMLGFDRPAVVRLFTEKGVFSMTGYTQAISRQTDDYFFLSEDSATITVDNPRVV